MTKRWHTAQDYCSDPAGYEAHRRTRQPEAHAKELAALRRQVEELEKLLDSMESIATGDTLRERVENAIKYYATQMGRWCEKHPQQRKGRPPARATLARYKGKAGGECETCLHSQLSPDGGHCYMFKEKPVRQCAQWQQARYGGGGEEVEA